MDGTLAHLESLFQFSDEFEQTMPLYQLSVISYQLSTLCYPVCSRPTDLSEKLYLKMAVILNAAK
jgi:hypothetical protein